MKHIAFILFLLLPLCLRGQQATGEQIVAQKIVNELYAAAGQQATPVPQVKISGDNQVVAVYRPYDNEIILDLKTYQLCRNLGRDSAAALAYLMGHELAHAFQKELRNRRVNTNFLAYDRHFQGAERFEKTADIQGVFIAYLAGYRLEGILPNILEKIYRGYDLMDKNIPGYPSFEERSRSAEEVLDIINRLVDLFEVSQYLTLYGDYQLAASSLEYILQYHQGSEIYNNLGVLYLSAAQDYFDPATDQYVYPFELDASSPLQKIEQSRGELPPQDRLIRRRFLEKAEESFRKALELQPEYGLAHLNLVCAILLGNRPQEALEYIDKHGLLNKPVAGSKLHFQIQMVFGIASALVMDRLTAGIAFQEVAESGREVNAFQAQYNQDVLNERDPFFFIGQQFEFPAQFSALLQSIPLGRTSQWPSFPLDAESGLQLKTNHSGNVSTFTFGNAEGNELSIMRFENNMAPNLSLTDEPTMLNRHFFYNLIPTTDGYFLLSEKEKVALKIDDRGRVQETVRFIVH